MFGQVDDLDRAGETPSALREQCGDAGMVRVLRPVHELGLVLGVPFEDLLDRKHAEQPAVWAVKRQRVADRRVDRRSQGLPGCSREARRRAASRRRRASSQSDPWKPRRRAEASDCEQLEIRGLACAQVDTGEAVRAVDQRIAHVPAREQVNELASVRRNHRTRATSSRRGAGRTRSCPGLPTGRRGDPRRASPGRVQ